MGRATRPRVTRLACSGWVGVAPAASPDVRYGLPGLRSLGAACASPFMAALASYAGSTAGATPRGFRLWHAHQTTAGPEARRSRSGGGPPRKPSQDGEGFREYGSPWGPWMALAIAPLHPYRACIGLRDCTAGGRASRLGATLACPAAAEARRGAPVGCPPGGRAHFAAATCGREGESPRGPWMAPRAL
jgi:hypothetical protein